MVKAKNTLCNSESVTLLNLLSVRKTNHIRRSSGKAVRAPTIQIPIVISARSTNLQQSGGKGQCSLTALRPMVILLASANETIPLVPAIVVSVLTAHNRQEKTADVLLC